MNTAPLTAQPVASPHAHGGNSVTRTMFRVQLALVPATLYGFWLFGWPSFFLWLLTILSCLGFEALSLKLTGSARLKATLHDGSALLTGWLLAMTLPPWAPWWVAVVGGFIAIVIGKQVFGGVGQNVFNPAMVARVALLVSFPVPLTQWVLPASLASVPSPDFLQGLHIFVTSAPPLDGMASASLLGHAKTELSRGIDLFHSLTGPEAPALRVNGRKVSNGWANLETLWMGIGDSLYGFRVYPIAPLVSIMRGNRFMRRFDFDPEAVVRLCWAGVRPLNLDAPVRYLSAAEGGVSHFKYLRDNALLTWMHTRLFIGFVLRLPRLLIRYLMAGTE